MRSTSRSACLPVCLSAANRCFDQVEEPGPAHEPMKRRLCVIKDGPQVTKCVFMAPLADCGCTARKMRGRKQRATMYRLEYPLRPCNNGLNLLLCPT
jgi:hypothetical protein